MMNHKVPVLSLPTKKTPAAQHRRQTIWQIWVPLAASLLILFAIMTLTIVGAVQGNPQIERWGNLSSIYLIIPVLFVGLILLALNGAGVYGLAKLLKLMPEWFLYLHIKIVQIVLLIRTALDSITQPILAFNQFTARAEALWLHFFRSNPKP